ncbi:hypothetical protein D3C83_220180 [compost metagenome]
MLEDGYRSGSANELRLNIKLKSRRGEPATSLATSLSLHEEPSPEEVEAIRREELRKQQEKRDELELARMQAAKQQAQ